MLTKTILRAPVAAAISSWVILIGRNEISLPAFFN